MVGKRYDEPRSNTTKTKSGGLLSEGLCRTIRDLSEAPELNGLVSVKAPSQAVRARILNTLYFERHTEIRVARRSYHVSYSNKGEFSVFALFLRVVTLRACELVLCSCIVHHAVVWFSFSRYQLCY